MKKFFLEQKSESLLVLFAMIWVVFGWYSLSLVLGGIFFTPLVVFGFILFGGLTLWGAYLFWNHSPLDKRLVLVFAFLYALSLLFVSGNAPSIFSGRDQGSISEAAWRLSEHHALPFRSAGETTFFQIYGPGTALNFPGFAYTQSGRLITQFPLAYTAYLGAFVSLFGLAGYALGNAVLFFFFLVLFYNLLRLFSGPLYAGFGLLLASFSFLPVWFSKFTLTENFALFLFVSLAYSLVLLRRDGKFISYASTLLSAGLLAFTRIEGYAILALVLGVFCFTPNVRQIWKTYRFKSLVVPGIIFFLFFLRNFFLNLPYYKNIGKAFLKLLQGFGGDGVSLGSGSTFSLGPLFFSYGLLFLFGIGIFGLLVFLKEKKYGPLLPVLIALPTFVYLFVPSITPDHPWMLRRYLFTLFPVLLFSAVLGIGLLFAKERIFPLLSPPRKRLSVLLFIFAGLLLLELPAWWTGVVYAENKDLRRETEEFARRFSDRDLILVDRFATGSGYAMITGPASFLSGKNFVYFFNPEDLAKLDRSVYEHVYLVTPLEQFPRYAQAFGARMKRQGSVVFTLDQLENRSLKEGTFRLPQKTVTKMENLVFEIE